MKCSRCGSDNAEQMSFCTACGERLKKETENTAIDEKKNPPAQVLGKTTNCQICNTKISEDTIYCHMCGSRQKQTLPDKSDADAVSFDVDIEEKTGEAVKNCPVCGETISPETGSCSACAKSETAKPEKNTGTLKNAEAIEKIDVKNIEPMMALIAKMKPEETKKTQTENKDISEEPQQTKTEQTETIKKEQVVPDEENEQKNKRAVEKKSNAAKEFLPPESSEENVVSLKAAKTDSTTQETNPQNEKNQNKNETGISESAKTEVRGKENPQQTKDNQSKPASDKKNSEKAPAVQSITPKEASVKQQNTKPAKQQAKEKAEPENITNQWKSISVAGRAAETSVSAQAPVLPQTDNKNQLVHSPKNTQADNTNAQITAQAQTPVSLRYENKKQPAYNPKSVQAHAAPVQTYTPAQPPAEKKKQPQPPNRKTASASQMPAQVFMPAQPPAPPQVAAPYPGASAEYNNVPPVPKKKGKKAVFAVLVILIVILLSASFGIFYMARSSNYDEAVQYMDAGQYAEAYEIFEKLGNYKDSSANAAECYKYVKYDEAVELMDAAYYKEAAKIFSELGNFKDSGKLLNKCTLFYDAINYFNEGRYWHAYNTFEQLGGYGDSEEWMEKCKQKRPVNGVEEKGEAHAEGTASIKIINTTELDAYFVIKDLNGDEWGGIYIQAGTEITVSIKSGEYSANLAVGTEWFGIIDMFGRGKDASYQQNIPVDNQGNTSFFMSPNETKSFTIYN